MAKTPQTSKLTYITLVISIIALIIAIYGLVAPKRHFGPMHKFNPNQIEQQAHFRDRQPANRDARPDMRKDAHRPQPNMAPDAQRPMPRPMPQPTPAQGE